MKARLSIVFALVLAFAFPAWSAPPVPNPSAPPVANKLLEAQQLLAAKQIDSAENIIVSELAAAPRDTNWITLLAEVRLEQRRTREALELVEEADQLAGASPQRAILASFIESAGGRLDLAEASMREAIRLDPSNPTPHYFLSRLLYTDNRFDEAIAESNKAISLFPGFIRAYENIGLCYEGKHAPQEAEHWYLEAIHREATSPDKTEWPMLDLATLMIHQNRYAEAKPYLEQALQINPNNSQSLVQMGFLLEETGDPKGALEKFRAAIQNDPRSGDAYYQAARICKKLGYSDEAEKDFKKFSEVHGNP